MKTYTQYKLTDAQLKRLSALVNKTKNASTGGVAGDALVRKGLAVDINEDREFKQVFGEGTYTRKVFVRREATFLGQEALTQARQEGW